MPILASLSSWNESRHLRATVSVVGDTPRFVRPGSGMGRGMADEAPPVCPPIAGCSIPPPFRALAPEGERVAQTKT
jgi:hypothetical protein